MFKRANKITSLLVAAAAVASMVPAYAADVKKVDSQDGTVYNAVAYKDGQFYIDGEVNDKDEASYYLANGKYNALSDVDAGSDSTAYGTKYVDINDGDYFVDLTSGKVTSDNVADEARDDAASNLRKKVKNDVDGRYIKDDNVPGDTNTLKDYDSTTPSGIVITQDNDTAKKIYSIPGAKFADEWFATAFKNDDNTNGIVGKGTGYLNVYTDGAGKYIDGDYNLGKIKVDTTTSAGTKTVYVENTDDDYDTANSSKVKAKVEDAKVIAQDKDYIYRFATVTIYTTGATITKIDGHDVNASSQTAFTDKTATSVSFRALQKISKAQSSGDIGGVKYAKTAYTYILSDDTEDSKGGLKTKSADFAYDYYTVANGKVVGYKKDGSNTVKSRTATLKSEDGLYYTDLGSEASEDVEVKDSKFAVDVDVDGNLWRLNDGYLYQWNNDEDWDKVYKVDGSFNELSVYDKNNIVAWNQDDESYAVIGGKTTTKDTDTTGAATGTTTTAAAGWVKNTDGTWSYNKAGVKATGWLQDGATWYYLNTNGIMQTGWQNVGGTWYFLNASGAMQTGWINDGGTWYYCNASGAMLANTVVDGYVLGASGAWVK